MKLKEIANHFTADKADIIRLKWKIILIKGDTSSI